MPLPGNTEDTLAPEQREPSREPGPTPLTNLTNYRSMDISVSMKVNLYEAKTQLSALVERAAAGEEVIIAKAGRPVARIVALPSSRPPRRPGRAKGEIRIGSDFDAPLPPDIADAFGEVDGTARE